MEIETEEGEGDGDGNRDEEGGGGILWKFLDISYSTYFAYDSSKIPNDADVKH